MTLPILLSAAAALVFSPEDASFAYNTTKEFVHDCTPRDAGTIRGSCAANWILDRSSITGADVRRDVFKAMSPKGERQFTNLYAEFKANATNRWVVLVSHFDTKTGCPGANDGAATSALLISLANILVNMPAYPGNILLVWTDAEESMGPSYGKDDGFQGAQRAVEYLKKRDRAVQAVIGLDMLGDRDLKISIPANGTPTLAKIACHAANRIGETNLVSCVDFSVKDDHNVFLMAGYSAIDLIDFEYGPKNAWWHTAEDTCDKVSEESLLKTGRLVAEMLKLLL